MARLSATERQRQDRKAARTRRSRERKIRAALEGYLPELRKRWAEVAATGSSERDCILCREAGGAGKCYACPAFGEPVFGVSRGLHCSDFIPTPPSCLDVAAGHVLMGGRDRYDRKTGKPLQSQTALERAREYGRKMLALLDNASGGATTAPPTQTLAQDGGGP